MKALSIDQIREYIPECTEIRSCPELYSCIDSNYRLCDNKDKPCYITSKGEYIEGIIILDFKNNIITAHKFHEKEEYVRVITPNGVDIKMDGKEPKEKLKKVLRSIR